VIACGYVLSRKTLNVVVSRGPGSRGTNLILENPKEWLSGGGGKCMLSRGLRISRTGLTGGEILPVRGY
jgi:hypothetical protein